MLTLDWRPRLQRCRLVSLLDQCLCVCIGLGGMRSPCYYGRDVVESALLLWEKLLRRPISAMLATRVKPNVASLLNPLQLDVETSGGCEAIVHSSRRILAHLDKDERYGLLMIDLQNAFNLVICATFLSHVRARIPLLYSWVNFCYAEEHGHLWVGDRRFRSVIGTQQDDSLGPLMFFLAL